MTERVYLVDGSAYIFRAFYAVQGLSTSSGFPTNALFGFCRMLLKLLEDAASDHVAVVFDAGRLTFRNDLYSEYKANRSECPEDLAKQMPYFSEFCEALGLPVYMKEGFEADDLLGTLVECLKDHDTEVVIVSADKDLCQLVNDKVSVWDTMRDRWFRPAEVQEKFGVPPEMIIDFLGLTGDTSDNIPGLKGVGPKTAVQLLEAYGSIEGLIEHKEELLENKSIRSRKKISAQLHEDDEVDLLRLSRQLVTIKRDVPFELSSSVGSDQEVLKMSPETLIETISRNEIDEDAIGSLASRFEMQSLFKDLSLVAPGAKESQLSEFTYCTVPESEFADWCQEFLKQSEYSIDLETTSLDPLEAEVSGIAVCWQDDLAWYVPVAHCDAQGERLDGQITWETFVDTCRVSLEDPAIKKIGQNLKYDAGVLRALGVTLRGIAFDTMVAAYLLHPDRNGRSLGALAKEHLKHTVKEYSDVVEKGSLFSSVSLEDATEYAAEDAHIAWLLRAALQPQLEKEDLLEVFETLEMPLVEILTAMEIKGIKLDVDLLAGMSEDLGGRLATLEQQIYKEAGVEFNMNSPKQLSHVLFEVLGIPTKGLKKTKTGTSTDSSVLEKLSAVHALPSLILEYRGLHKLKSTYVDALPAQVAASTARIHTRFNQTVTGTGRLSSSDPNLQNIPIQSEEGRKVRAAFVAEPGSVLISADYSQVELRLLAHLSEDEAFIEAFRSGADIHTATASELLGIPADEITPEDRRIGKTLNFGIVYGMSGFRLGRELGIPVSEANAYIEGYFGRYPGIRSLFDRLESDALERGYVTTLFGRRRYLEGMESRGRDQGFLRRAAINAPIQGSAADVIKLAMLALEKRIKDEQLQLVMLLQIHDELVFECPESLAEEYKEVIRQEMEQVVNLSVPLSVDVGVGQNWYEAH